MKLSFIGRLSGPLKVGLTFALVAIALSLFGVLRNPDTPASPQTILIATLIAGITWGLIAWAIATATMDVEDELAEQDDSPLE